MIQIKSNLEQNTPYSWERLMYHRSGLKRSEVRGTLQNTWWKNRRPFKSQIKWGISHTNIAQITYRMSPYDCDFSMRFWTQVRNRSVPSPVFLNPHHTTFFSFPFYHFQLSSSRLGASRTAGLALFLCSLKTFGNTLTGTTWLKQWEHARN